MNPSSDPVNGINIFNEKPLHAALKDWYAAPGDLQETRVDGYIIDLIHDDVLIEIQTGSFAALRRKLERLTHEHAVRLVYPVAQEKWIITQPAEEGAAQTRRKSPRRGRVEHVFRELVYLPDLLARPKFSLEVVLIQEEEVRRAEGKKTRWNKGWVKQERRLLNVIERRIFAEPADLAALLPPGLPALFTTREIAKAARIPPRLAQQMVYCLRGYGVIQQNGKRGRALVYQMA